MIRLVTAICIDIRSSSSAWTLGSRRLRKRCCETRKRRKRLEMRRRWWVFTGKTGGKSWENVGKTLEKHWEHVKILGKDGENQTNTYENHGNM